MSKYEITVTGNCRDIANSAWISTTDEIKTKSRTDEDVDRRAHVSWSEAVGRIERIVMDTVEDLEKKEGGDIYAQELLSCWKRIVKG